MKLSVVIPAYRRSPLTTRHVEECMKSSLLPDEIIVVNDGGDKDLRDMLFNLKRNVPITYARVEQDILWNFNGACNLGVWLSQGDIIALEDTDHIPDRDLYKNALPLFDGTIERLGVARKVVDISELSKPMEEWVVKKLWGSNQMTTLFTRDLYLKLKGQDERFGGNYGYMAMDWHNRYNNIYKAKNSRTKYFWAVIGDEGEPGLQRGMSEVNRRFYRENSHKGHPQHPEGILKFTYHFEKWNTSQS
mgnify:FL=1